MPRFELLPFPLLFQDTSDDYFSKLNFYSSNFQTEESYTISIGTKFYFNLHRCSEETQSDWVTFSNYQIGIDDRRYEHLCGQVTDKKKKKIADSDGNFFRVTFHSDEVYDATGFKAVYEFRDKEGQFLIFSIF